MANSVDNVRVGATGAIYRAPLGTALPTDATSALNAAFVDVGYVGEDGVEEVIDRETNKIKAWGGDTVRTPMTGHDTSYSLAFLETNNETVNAYYGNGTAASVDINSDDLGHHAWVIEIVDGDYTIRICIADGEITETGPVSYASADAIAYPVVITCYPDATDDKAHRYMDDGVIS